LSAPNMCTKIYIQITGALDMAGYLVDFVDRVWARSKVSGFGQIQNYCIRIRPDPNSNPVRSTLWRCDQNV